MDSFFVTVLHTLNDLLTAGVAITAFSLLLYALSFNLRDRVARSFAIILVCVVIVYVGEAISGVAPSANQIEFWMRLQWVGIIFIPASYVHLSDALLATTGEPSQGWRVFLVRLGYLVSLAFLISLTFGWLVGPLVIEGQAAPHFQRTWLTWVFTIYYGLALIATWRNFWLSYRRTHTSTSRRRMTYLLTGALAPALGSFPYLLFGPGFADRHQLIFWLAVTISNTLVSTLTPLMAYAVAFFGVPWPDRVVKRRLLKWVMRGPVTASTVLAITTIIRRAGVWAGMDFSAVMPVIMVASILIMEHLITLAAPFWERRLFGGKDRAEMELLQTLEQRLLTLGDMQQFMEAILAAVCDRLQASKAFVATLGSPVENQRPLELLVTIGGDSTLEGENLSTNLLEAVTHNGGKPSLFVWGDYWLIPLFSKPGGQNLQSEQGLAGLNGNTPELLGLLGVMRQPGQRLDEGQDETLTILTDRAAQALRDRSRQQKAFSSLQELTPRMDIIQRFRAAARYGNPEVLAKPEAPFEQSDLASWVKEALTHYWGGPKLSQSPLLSLKIVQQAALEHEENPTNALRAILRRAIEQVRPEGERRFTAEWILYNILDMKFVEGRKVREIAMRLAMSEADLYRKQRVAIEAVADIIVTMEQEARNQVTAPTREVAVNTEVPASKNH